MAHATCELMWIQSLLSEMVIIYNKPMVMYCDNQTAIYIANNLIFNERTNHIEVNCHFIRDIVMSLCSSHRVVNLDICSLKTYLKRVFQVCVVMRMIDIYAPAWGEY